MSNLLNDEKMEKILNELSDEYKKLLLNALLARSNLLDELSISELLHLDAEIKKPLFKDYQREKQRQKRFLIMGIAYMLTGLLMVFLVQMTNSDFMITTNDKFILSVSVLIGLLGFIVIFASYLIPTLRTPFTIPLDYYKSESPSLLEYEVVAKWRELEGIVDEISLNSDVKTPHSIIDFLLKYRFINHEETHILSKFLRMRNNVVHAKGAEFSKTEIMDTVKRVEKIIERINRRV